MGRRLFQKLGAAAPIGTAVAIVLMGCSLVIRHFDGPSWLLAATALVAFSWVGLAAAAYAVTADGKRWFLLPAALFPFAGLVVGIRSSSRLVITGMLIVVALALGVAILRSGLQEVLGALAERAGIFATGFG